jgi:GH15 family glucan-1,4-alpha-glucosidase
MTMPCRIEDYALIGDGETAALVSRTGSIDWLCWPRFDSAACFAALLGDARNGRWIIAPEAPPARTTRRYLDDTLVLETTFETATGTVTLVDFMPPRGSASDVVRMVRGVRGRVRLRSELVIRFEYGSIIPWVTQAHGGETELRAVAGPDSLTLRTPVRFRGVDTRSIAEFEIEAGECVPFVLTYAASHLPTPAPVNAERALSDTIDFWHEWISRCSDDTPWRPAVVRSPDHLFARASGWNAKLGLSLLLAARRDIHAAFSDGRRILRGGRMLARLARACAGRRSRAGADHVWARR